MGKDSLSPRDQLTLEIARMLREDFLQQNAFMDVDSYSSFDRQLRLLALILHYEDLCRDAIAKNVELPALFAIPARERLGWAKYAAAEEYAVIGQFHSMFSLLYRVFFLGIYFITEMRF